MIVVKETVSLDCDTLEEYMSTISQLESSGYIISDNNPIEFSYTATREYNYSG